MNKTLKHKSILLLTIFCFAVSIAIIFLFADKVAIVQATENNAKSPGYIITETVPIEYVQLIANNDGEIRPTETVNFRVELTPIYAIETAKSIEYCVIQGNSYVVQNGNQITVRENATIGSEFSVKAIVDGLSSNTLNFIIIDIPVSQIYILNKEEKIQQNRTMLIETQVLPFDAINKKVRYSVTNGASYASISQNGMLTAGNNLTSGELTVTVKVEALSNSEIFTERSFLIYVPTKNLNIELNKQYPTEGDKIKLYAKADSNESSIVQDFAVREQDKKYVKSLVGNVLTIKDNITDFNPSVTVYYSRDGIIAEKLIEIHIFAKSIKFESSIQTIKQGGMSQFCIVPTPANATLKNLKFSLGDYENAFITESGLFTALVLPDKITANVEIIATLDGITNSTFINILRPNILLTANNYEPTSSSTSSQTVKLITEVDGIAQIDNLNFNLKSGKNYVQGGQIHNGSFTINRGISAFNPEIIISVSFGTWESNDIYIRPKVLVESMSINNDSVKFVEQQRENYDFSGKCYPVNAAKANDGLNYSLNVPSSIATINPNGILSVKAAAPIGTRITININGPDGVGSTHIVTVKTVYATELRIDKVTDQTGTEIINYATVNPNDILTFGASFPMPFNITESQKIYSVEYHSGSNIATINGQTATIKVQSQIEGYNPSITFKIFSNQNGEMLVQYFTIYVHISVANIEYTQLKTEVAEGDIIAISDLVLAVAKPDNSNIREIEYTVTEFATKIGKYVYVDNNLTSGNLSFTLILTSEDKIVSLVYNIYVEAKSIEFTANNYNPLTQINGGESVTLTITKDVSASLDMIVRIAKGADLIVGNYTNGHIFSLSYDQSGKASLIFTIKSSSAIDLDKLVQFEVEQGALNKKLNFVIYKPIESFIVKTDKVVNGVNYITRGVANNLNINYTSSASESDKWTVSITEINISNRSKATITVPQNAPAGKIYKAIFTTNDRLSKTFEFTFTVGELDESLFKFINGQNNASSNPYDMDSNDKKISSSYPQLWVGRKTDVSITYNGFDLRSYGIYINNVGFNYGSNYATMSKVDFNTAQLAIKDDASGKGFVEPKIVIQDGTTTYTICLKTINIFRPMSGTPTLTNGSIVKSSTKLLLGNGTFDTKATYGLNCLIFYGSDLDGASLTHSGQMTIIADTASSSQLIFLRTIKEDGSYTQTYNDIYEVWYEAELTQSIHRITLSKASGSGGTDSICAVSGRSKSITIPSRTGYIFDGYYTNSTEYYDKYGNLKVDHSDYYNTSSITAKWVKVLYTTKSIIEKTITDDNVYSYKQSISPSFDIGKLKQLGYTKIDINITFNCKEIHDGYQDVRLFSGSDDKRIGDKTIEHGGSGRDYTWRSNTLDFSISIDSFSANSASFYIGWGAHGGLDDDWSLGERTVTVTANK